jgi:hypothetical protein
MWYNSIVPKGEGHKTSPKKTLKNLKKMLDFFNKIIYNIYKEREKKTSR